VKLLLPLLGALGLSLLGLPLLVVAVIATHPWLAVGARVGPVEVVEPTPAPVAAAPTLAPAPSLSGSPAAIVAEAMKWVNARVPYQWGGCTTAGVDCSCFVRNVLAVFGIRAPRTTVEQIRWAARSRATSSPSATSCSSTTPAPSAGRTRPTRGSTSGVG
jgi:cell wall-associated NlpC family hydrolase